MSEDKRYDYLCTSRFGVFYWDRTIKKVVMEDHNHNMVAADNYIVLNRGSHWEAKLRPPTRIIEEEE